MDLAAFLQKLGNNFKSAIKSTETDRMNFYHLCNTLTLKFITSHKISFVEKLQGLIAAFIIYGKMRVQQLERKNLVIATNYLTNLTVETGRLVLSHEYTTLVNDSPTKSNLLSTVSNLAKNLQPMPHESKLVEALEHVIVNGWDFPILVKLINGDEIDEEKALSYMRDQEHPNFLKLRLDLLMSHGCCEHAANFLLWLLKYQETKEDHYLIYLHLSYLFITGRFQEFLHTCTKLSSPTACKVMTNVMVHPHHCFSSPHMPLLLSRTLVTMTVFNNSYFCNKEIIKYWVKTEHQHSQSNKETFECRISDLAFNTKEPKFVINLVEILHQEFQKTYVPLCTNLIMKALTTSRHAYNCARIYLVDSFTNQAAFRCMLALLHLLEKLYCENFLIRVYCQICNLVLMPCDAKYFAVEKTCLELQTQFENSPSDPDNQFDKIKSVFIKTPLEDALYTLISLIVDRHRAMKPWQWETVMKPAMLTVMAEAGWSYDPITRRFRKCKILMSNNNFFAIANRQTENARPISRVANTTRKKNSSDDVNFSINRATVVTNLRQRSQRKQKSKCRKRLRIIEYSDESDGDMSDYNMKTDSDKDGTISDDNDDDFEDEKNEPVVTKVDRPRSRTTRSREPVVKNQPEPVVQSQSEPVIESQSEPVIQSQSEPVIQTQSDAPSVNCDKEVQSKDQSVETPVCDVDMEKPVAASEDVESKNQSAKSSASVKEEESDDRPVVLSYEKEVELKNECIKFLNSAKVRLRRLSELDVEATKSKIRKLEPAEKSDERRTLESNGFCSSNADNEPKLNNQDYSSFSSGEGTRGPIVPSVQASTTAE